MDEAKDLIKDIDLKKPYVLYIHGFQEHPSNESIGTIVQGKSILILRAATNFPRISMFILKYFSQFLAYLQRGTDNIVILDWSPIAFDNYLIVSRRAKDIAKVTAKAITSLTNAGLNVDTIHIVGHSMGAQIAGFVGQFLDFKIPRVTGIRSIYQLID